MLSSKTRTLSKEDLERYREKIAIVGGKDPYTFPFDSNVLPLTVDYDMILSYLLNTLSFRTGNPVRNRKSLEASKSFERGFVKEVKGHIFGNVFAVHGKVLHSMRINEPPAELWILIQAESSRDKAAGEIHSAHCDCTAGAGETCSHVAAVLYALNYARDTCLGKKISVTQLPAYWMQPSGSAQQDLYMPIEEIDFGRTVETYCELRDCNIEKSEEDTKDLISQLMISGQDVAASRAFFSTSEMDCESDDVKMVSYVENSFCLQKLYDSDLVGHPLQVIIESGREINWKVSDEDATLIERLTRDQSSNPLWYKLRFGRITASCFAKCVKTKITNPSISVIKSICTINECQEFPATLYGKRHEHKAVSAAVSLFKYEKHRNFTSRQCGLIINSDYPYFAASPDNLFECNCCGKVVVEAKCPFNFGNFNREEGINSLLSRQSPYILRDSNDNIVMNHKHEYYFQIQMQMFLSKASYGLFVIWAPKFTVFIKVKKNNVFWEIHSNKASSFFEQVLIPEILTKYYTAAQPNN